MDWAAVHGGEHRRRVALPGYPFERKRYWIEPDTRSGASGRQGEVRKRPDIADWFSVPSWKRLAPPGLAGPGAAERQSWLVFVGDGELDARLVAGLEGAGHRVTTVRAGERLERLSDRGWSLDPADAAQYRELLDALAGEGGLPDRIVHLWALAASQFEECQQLGFHSVVSLARALSDLG